MKKFIVLLFPLFLYGNNYPHFTNNDFLHIELKSGKIAKNRTLDYQKKIDSLKNSPKQKQLNSINLYLNQLLPQYDDVIQQKEDHWATPKEFLEKGFGDCEDYAIIKYFSLIKLGFDEKKLFITTVDEKFSGGYHMVLTYFKEKNKPPLVLDNLSFRVLDLKTREDIKADIFINSQGVYKMDNSYKLHKIAKTTKQYADLIKKVQKNF